MSALTLNRFLSTGTQDYNTNDEIQVYTEFKQKRCFIINEFLFEIWQFNFNRCELSLIYLNHIIS